MQCIGCRGMLDVVCVLRSGGKVGYCADWVHRLQRAVDRNLTLPHRFVCLTDTPVECESIPLAHDHEGFWSKLELFRPGLFAGPTLYIDLDTVICNNINDVVHRASGHEFVMWMEPDKGIHSSALMYWQGDQSRIWDVYCSKPFEYWKSLYASPPLYGDQAVVSEHVSHVVFQDICPPEWFHIASKHDHDMDLSNIRMLMFRKTKQKPSTMQHHALVQQHWI